GCDALLALGPERLRDQAEVRGSVVSGFQRWTQGPVALLGEGKRFQDRGVAEPEPEAAESHPHEVLGRSRIEIVEQRGKNSALLLDRAWPGRGRDLHQPGVGV